TRGARDERVARCPDGTAAALWPAGPRSGSAAPAVPVRRRGYGLTGCWRGPTGPRDGFCFFVGREDDMFVCGGENICPRAVEQVPEAHPRRPVGRPTRCRPAGCTPLGRQHVPNLVPEARDVGPRGALGGIGITVEHGGEQSTVLVDGFIEPVHLVQSEE